MSTYAIPHDRETRRVDAQLIRMLDGVEQGRVRLLLLRWIFRLGRVHIVDEDHCGADAVGDLAYEPVVRDLVAEDPAAAVGIEDDRQDFRGSGCGGPDDSNARLPRRADRPDHILDVRVQEPYRLRLQVRQDLVRRPGAELAERRPAQAIDERLRRRFESHGTAPLCWPPME